MRKLLKIKYVDNKEICEICQENNMKTCYCPKETLFCATYIYINEHRDKFKKEEINYLF